MNEMVALALQNATPGQLAIALQAKLTRNTEVKIKQSWIRVQHTQHCDRLLSAESIDKALATNIATFC